MYLVHSRIIAVAAALVVSAGLTSCSAYNRYEHGKPDQVMETEARLQQAGFHRIPIDTPEQNGAVAQLALYQLNRYDSVKGSVFWYADPTICKCLYQGDLQAYLRYEGSLQQDKDIAEYMNDTEPDQLAYLGYFESFPPPSMFGPVWPPFFVVLPGPGGAIRPIYRGPGVIHSRGGGGWGGGPIHMHGGSGGGNSIGRGGGRSGGHR
jgi:uncharacterized membrane protein YgcG